MSKRERIEDLGRLSFLLDTIFFDSIFEERYWTRPKDAWSSFSSLDEDQKRSFIEQIAYGLERIRDEIAKCCCIADGKDED